ncbi:MAG TPA: DUF3394 domain-containing protein, partial [Aliiroseovarius sp.]|nr:DUF3394 domain-containing protein [Aliiroseovarius sp.]
YFGILADDTPPVGLAAYAAAAISRGDPIKTGLQGFGYDIRTALLPFLFIFNTDLLLINVGPAKAVFVFIVAVIAMLLFAAATQGWFLTRSRKWESVALLLVAFTLFRPGFWLDTIEPPFEIHAADQTIGLVESLPEGESVRLRLVGPDFDDPDKMTQTNIEVVMGPKEGTAEDRLMAIGLDVLEEDGKITFSGFTWNFPDQDLKERLDQEFEFYGDSPVIVEEVLTRRDRMPKEIFYIPGLALLALVIWLQRGRARKIKPAAA